MMKTPLTMPAVRGSRWYRRFRTASRPSVGSLFIWLWTTNEKPNSMPPDARKRKAAAAVARKTPLGILTIYRGIKTVRASLAGKVVVDFEPLNCLEESKEGNQPQSIVVFPPRQALDFWSELDENKRRFDAFDDQRLCCVFDYQARLPLFHQSTQGQGQ